ncbi:MAG: fumarylacetoacetate hydrolase family protein [Pseudomonadota bacterium]
MRTDDLVDTLGQARLAGEPLPEDVYSTMPDRHEAAYALQDQLAVWLSDNGLGAVAGFKAESTNDTAQAALGLDGPLLGRLMSGRQMLSGDSIKRGNCPIGVECELAFRVGHDVAPWAETWQPAEVGAVLAEAIPAIEIIENRYGKPPERPVTAIIADDIFQKAYVLGPANAAWRDMPLEAITARVSVNGREVAVGGGANVLGNPLNSVAFVLNNLSKRGLLLHAGAVIMTGTMTPAFFMNEFPAEIEIELDGIGTCKATVT